MWNKQVFIAAYFYYLNLNQFMNLRPFNDFLIFFWEILIFCYLHLWNENHLTSKSDFFSSRDSSWTIFVSFYHRFFTHSIFFFALHNIKNEQEKINEMKILFLFSHLFYHLHILIEYVFFSFAVSRSFFFIFI